MKKLIAFVLTAACLLGLTACGAKEEEKAVDLNALYTEYASMMPEMATMDENTMLNFLGIQADTCEVAIAAISTDGMRTDEVWLIQAKDADSLAHVQEMAQLRLEAKSDETISYAPDQYAVVEKAQVITKGNYLAFLVSPDVDALAEKFNALFA